MPTGVNMNQQKILFPLDYTGFSEDILQWAVRYLDNSTCSISCLIVVDTLEKLDKLHRASKILEEAKKLFETWGFNKVKCDFIIHRDIPNAVCDYANTNSIDQIIMATHGQSFARMPLDSVSQKIMKNAKQPVLILKNPALSTTEEAHLSRDQVISILIPVSDEKTAGRLIALMEGLVNKEAAVIHVLHAVVYDTDNIGYLNMKLKEASRIIENNKRALENAGYWVADAEIAVGEVADVISKYANAKKSDYIALLSWGRSHLKRLCFGSVSAGLLKQNKHKIFLFSEGKALQIKRKAVERIPMLMQLRPSIRQ
ncbi:MAG: uspA14 [Vampirovibrio sp.]|nr:uspA14 [Vampirovibrio sp.]